VTIKCHAVGLLIQQIFNFGERRIISVLAMTAITDVQVLAAFNAETFALWIMQGLYGNFQ